MRLRAIGSRKRRGQGEGTFHQRKRLFAVVATGGTTNAGIIDDLAGIASVCDEERIWFHVDAAHGAVALHLFSIRFS